MKQRKDGRYQKRVWDGTYVRGCKHYVSVYVSDPTEVTEAVSEFKTKNTRKQKSVTGSGIDLYSYSLEWLNSAKAMCEIGTLAMYKNIINVYIAPNSVPLCNLNARDLQAIINSAKDKPRTCQQIKLTLKQVLSYAEVDRLIEAGRTNEMMSRLQLPKYKVKEKEPLSDTEKKAVFKAVLNPKQRLFLLTLYYCGLRREEALILSKNDCLTGSFNINKAVCFDENEPVKKSTKTERGNRTVPIPKPLWDSLSDYIKDMKPTDLLFPDQKGNLMTKSSYRRFWETIQKKLSEYDGNDYSTLTAHRFRHNYCTMLCYQSATKRNITTKKIAELLGDTEKMVLEVYSHVIEEKEDTDNAIESALKFDHQFDHQTDHHLTTI